MKWGLHLKFWIMVTLVTLLAIPALVTVPASLERITSEVGMTRSVFGDEATDSIVARSKAVYETLFVRNGFVESLNRTHFSEDDLHRAQGLRGAVHHFSVVSNSYFGAMVVNLYGTLIRLFVIGHWLLYVAPFLVACAIDGFMTRSVKLASFGYQNPSAFSLAAHSMLWVVFFPILYLIAPLPVTPLFMPMWAVIMGLPLIIMVSNSQKIFGS